MFSRTLTFLFLSILWAGATTKVTEISFFDSVTLTTSSILLGDVASISGEYKEWLDTLSLGKPATPGYSRFVSKEALLYTAMPDSIRETLVFSGAVRTLVKRDSKEILYKDLEERVTELILDSLPWKREQVEVSFPYNQEKRVALLKDAYQVELQPLRKRRGRVQVSLMIKQEGWEQRVSMNTLIKVEAPVLVATKGLRRGELVEFAHCQVQMRDITTLSFEPFYTFSEIKNCRVKGVIREGNVISPRAVESTPVVAKGESVTIIAKSGNVAISIIGRARQDGALGEIISVENSNSHKIIRGKVVRQGVVEVYQGGRV